MEDSLLGLAGHIIKGSDFPTGSDVGFVSSVVGPATAGGRLA